MLKQRSTNLVVVRAGDKSLHGCWREGAQLGHFDLVVSHFGENQNLYCSPEENKVARKGGKWDGIHALLIEEPAITEKYDYFWFPDDDVSVSSGDVSRLFEIARLNLLDVCQPSLSHDSFYSHIIYLQCPSFKLRYVNSVEIMVPCIAKRSLQRILPFFSSTRSGFGLDGLWTKLMEDNFRKSAIIDTISVTHTRPIGGELHRQMKRLDQLSAIEERKILFDVLERTLSGILVYDAILIDGRECTNRFAITVKILADLLRTRKEKTRTSYWYHEIARLFFRQVSMNPELDFIGTDKLAASEIVKRALRFK
jgi:hypothetical protein